MIELKGKHNSAKIFTDLVDEASIAQITALLDQEFTENLRIHIMPDVHARVGCTVGITMPICDKAVLNVIGADISFEMEVVQLREQHIELQELNLA